MGIVKFVDELGLLRDLLYIYISKFNENQSADECSTVIDDGEEEIDLRNIIKGFSDIPEELRVFFHINESGNCFLVNYVMNAPEKELETFSADSYKSYLSDCEKTAFALLTFYFPAAKKDPSLLEPEYQGELSELISTSNYSDKMKFEFLKFFLSPEKYIRLLMRDMAKKKIEVTDYINSNIAKIEKEKNSFDKMFFSKQLMLSKENTVNIMEFETLYVTFCLVNKRLIMIKPYETYAVVVLGIDYMYYLKSLYTQHDENAANLLMFGKVISEKVRLEMIDMLIRNDEMTNTEMARELSLTPASCYYHTEMMQKTGILKYRTRGREVFFSIAEETFKSYGRLVFSYIGKIREKYAEK